MNLVQMILTLLLLRTVFQKNSTYLCGWYDVHISPIGQSVIPFKTSCWNCFLLQQNEKEDDFYFLERDDNENLW